MTPELLRSTDPTSARTRRGRRTQSSFPTPRRRSRRSWAGRMPRASPSSVPNDSRAAEGQQTLEIEPTQLCTNQAPEARGTASIERLRARRRQSLPPWNKPVAREVAGSSPVAPVKVLQIGICRCPYRRGRPPASFRPAHIPHGDRRTKPAGAGNSRKECRRPNEPAVVSYPIRKRGVCSDFVRLDNGPWLASRTDPAVPTDHERCAPCAGCRGGDRCTSFSWRANVNAGHTHASRAAHVPPRDGVRSGDSLQDSATRARNREPRW
jgi:hypothetical protein